MIEKQGSIRNTLATIAILGQAPRRIRDCCPRPYTGACLLYSVNTAIVGVRTSFPLSRMRTPPSGTGNRVKSANTFAPALTGCDIERQVVPQAIQPTITDVPTRINLSRSTPWTPAPSPSQPKCVNRARRAAHAGSRQATLDRKPCRRFSL